MGVGMSGLLGHRQNTHSQNGEDGVIAEVLNRLGMSDAQGMWCVEFGAWDGVHLSNTYRLVEEAGWNAVYIEGDHSRYLDLASLAARNQRVTPICAMVSSDRKSGSCLDALLEGTPLPREYALLSIDVDSDDLRIWEAHERYRPRIVCVEINSKIPPGRRQLHGGKSQGNSFTSMLELGQAKGYTLVCHTGNLIFVDNAYAPQLRLPTAILRSPERAFLPFALPRWHAKRLAQGARRRFGDSTI